MIELGMLDGVNIITREDTATGEQKTTLTLKVTPRPAELMQFLPHLLARQTLKVGVEVIQETLPEG